MDGKRTIPLAVLGWTAAMLVALAAGEAGGSDRVTVRNVPKYGSSSGYYGTSPASGMPAAPIAARVAVRKMTI